MGRALDTAYRVLATGFCFASFGLGGLLLWVAVFPLLTLAVRDERARVRAARAVIHRAFRLFVGLMRRVGVLSYEVRGGQRLLRPGLLVLANHPTLIDVVFLIALIPQADCVVRSGLATNPFTRGPVRAAGYVCNDAGQDLVWDSLEALAAGQTLLIFPEGTRTPRTGPSKLHRGAAQVAVRAPRDVTPVVIRCEPLTLGKGEKWYKVPPRRAHFTIQVGEDVPVAPFLDGPGSEPLATRRLTAWLTRYFEQEATRGGA
jgi:1-acyl-sn-glycerol-3-phosphate acyltransferase